MPDIPAYRLRAFEAGFIEPRIQNFREQPQLEKMVVQWSHTDPVTSLMSHLLVQLRILREAAEWIDQGKEAGYFSTSIVPHPIAVGQTDVRDLTELDLFLANRTLIPDPLEFRTREPDETAFESRLHSAVEDLTHDRVEFLRLSIFADDQDWNSVLRDMWELAGRIEDELKSENQSFGPETTNISESAARLSWAFNGSESELEHPAGPAGWRSANTLASERETARVVAFERARITLGSMARDIASAESGRVSLDSLSRREREIIWLATQGFSNRAIAQRLLIHVRTVEHHLHRVYTKLGIRNSRDLGSSLLPVFPAP